VCSNKRKGKTFHPILHKKRQRNRVQYSELTITSSPSAPAIGSGL
jgi:hypothetical protein